MTHAPATVAYYAAARHPNKRPLPEAGGAVRPTPKPAGPAAPASTTRSSTSSSSVLPTTPLAVVAPAPLDLPQSLPRARVRPLLVRLAPGASPHPRQALEALSPSTGQPLQRAFLLVDQLCKPKDRVRLWLAQVLVREAASTEVWAPQGGEGGYVVVKESDARFIRQYGRLWGEDPIAEMAALAVSTARPHPHVVPALACFEGTEGCQGLLYLILPHLPGEELFYLVTEAPGRQGLGEVGARSLVRQVAQGLLHLKAAHGLRHGDVSPENVMVSPDGRHATLIDLGMAERVPATVSAAAAAAGAGALLEPRPRRGKKQYMAPEIYEERAYCPWAADVWALGAMLYVCWTGCTVYRNPQDPHYLALRQPGGLQRLLREREARGATRALSPEAKELLGRMLAWDFAERLTLEEVLAHPWMRVVDAEAEEEEDEEEDPFLLSASTSFSSLGLEEAMAVGSGSFVGTDSAGSTSSSGSGASLSAFLRQEAAQAAAAVAASEQGRDDRVEMVEGDDEEEAAVAAASRGPLKKRSNNHPQPALVLEVGPGAMHGDSDNSLSSLESLYASNNGAGGSGSGFDGETSGSEGGEFEEEEDDDDDKTAMPASPLHLPSAAAGALGVDAMPFF